MQGPVNANIWVIPQQAALMLGAIVVGGFVQKLGALASHQKAVRQAFWNPELFFIFGRQL